MALPGRTRTVVALGLAQTLAWASSYYLPAILAPAIARDLSCSTPTVFAAFSAALLVSAAVGPFAGRAIDRWGGRTVLMASSLVFAVGLAALGLATNVPALFAAWVVLGVAMGSGLYEAAFASLVRLYGRDARASITGVTLFAGFASTVGWPLTTFLEASLDWRSACFAWAGLHVVLGLPLNGSLPKVEAAEPAASQAKTEQPDGSSTPLRAAVLLAVVFAVTWFISTAMAAHLPRLLVATGMTLTAAVAVGTLIGPSQVGGRLLEFGFLRHVHPLLSARLATLMHPLGAALLLVLGVPFAALFAILHGAGNGILTIAMGTLPLVLFGPQGYGKRQGLLMVPARVLQASAPWHFGLALDRWSTGTLWLSASLGLVGFAALLILPKTRDAPDSVPVT